MPTQTVLWRLTTGNGDLVALVSQSEEYGIPLLVRWNDRVFELSWTELEFTFDPPYTFMEIPAYQVAEKSQAVMIHDVC